MKPTQYLVFLFAAAASVVATSDTTTTKHDDDIDMTNFFVVEEEELLASPESGEHPLLRREVQELSECRPVPGTGPVTDFICGWAVGPPKDVCTNFQGTCDQLLNNYPCTCGTDTTTRSCKFCQMRTAHGIVCVKTNARVSFASNNPDNSGTNDCRCVALSDGTTRVNCTSPMTSTPPPTSPRVVTRAPTPPTPRPTPRAPVATCKARSVTCTAHAQCCSKYCARDHKKGGFKKAHRRVCRSPPNM